jgi:predicted ribosome quality control (RQC) complex YloA/Tae2 family protein
MHIKDYCLNKTGCAWNEEHRESLKRVGREAPPILEAREKDKLSKELDAIRPQYYSAVNKQPKRSQYPSPIPSINVLPKLRTFLKGRNVTKIEEHEDRIIIFCRKT